MDRESLMKIGAHLAVLSLIFQNISPASISSATAADIVNATTPGSAHVAALGATFVSNLPSSWTSVQGAWAYVNPLTCWQDGTNCSGSNPSTPYGYPTLPLNGKQQEYFQLNPNDAIVIFYQTPPTVAYYGFTQYLASIPGEAPLSGSLSDPLNLLEISTIGSTGPGQNMFNSFAVIVWTANVNTYNLIVSLLASQGIAAANVNFIPIPINMGTYPGWTGYPLPPLQMGTGLRADQFNMFLRAALPGSQTAWQNYAASSPFFVVRVSPPASTTLRPAPSVGFANETTGILEGTNQQNMPALQQALNDLVADIQTTNWMTWSFSSLVVYNNAINGWACIAQDSECGDNHDELSILDSSASVNVKTLHDVVIVAGVNHVATDKALYFNHTVYDPTNNGAVTVVDNRYLTSASALYWAGVTNPSDPRVQEFQSLYAYAVSYNCAGLEYCLTIPAPTANDPVGLEPGSPFKLFGRVVVDPARVDPPLNTFVRPSTAEIIANQSLLGTYNQ